MIQASVIIPCLLRVEQTLRTIDLILKSTGYKTEFDLEIIISDSSATDELKNALNEKYKDTIIYTKPEYVGIATGKNKGAKTATKEILIFCDSDIEVHPDTIKNTLASLKDNPTAAAVGGTVIWKGGPKNGEKDKPRPEDRMITKGSSVYIEALYSRYIATYKDVFFAVGGYDENVFNMRGEGSDLSVRYWRAGYPLSYDENIIVSHVEEAQHGITRNISHPEYGVAKDLLLLGYKYDGLGDEYKNFNKTVAANFKEFGEEGYSLIVRGIGSYYNLISEKKQILDEQKKLKPEYDFKFLEVFSNEKILNECIENSSSKLDQVHSKAFK